MTRGESRVMTELLEQIMESRRSGDMERLVGGLVKKGRVRVNEPSNQAKITDFELLW